MKTLLSGLNNGHAFTILATSQNQGTACLPVKGKGGFKQSYNNTLSPKGVSNITAYKDQYHRVLVSLEEAYFIFRMYKKHT